MVFTSKKWLSCLLGMWCLAAFSGCWVRDRSFAFDESDYFATVTEDVRYGDAAVIEEGGLPRQPMSVLDTSTADYWDMSLEEAIQLAISNSPVLRDLGAAVLRSPGTIRTILNPAIVETNPRTGVESALSAFDAQVAASAMFEKNDRALNNAILAGGTRILTQDIIALETEVYKTAATGTKYTVRQNIDYDASNQTGNQFPSAWSVNLDAEVRHPLMQGSGVQFNRIAGPNGEPGVLQGVVLARIDTDISLAEFQMAVRDLVSNVENAYWDLYFTYRDLHAKVQARNASLETWRRVYSWYLEGREGGEADREAQAREQYFRFEEEVQNSLTGRLFDGTRTNNGSSGGSFRGNPGVQVSERRLRLLMGISINDGRLIRPSNEPIMAEVVFDWNEVASEAIFRRAELRRQRYSVRRKEMELIANRNFLAPRIDALGRYRWRGFGKNLLDDDRVLNGTPNRFTSAFGSLADGDFQEWMLGVEMGYSVGFRQAHTAVRNAQLQLARERAILDEQERQILHDLSNAFADLKRAYQTAQTAYNRRMAAKKQLQVLRGLVEDNQPVNLDLLLDAERRFAEADISYHRALCEYVVAIKNTHFEKGTLLTYAQVFLSEDEGETIQTSPAAGAKREDINYAMPESTKAPQVQTAALPQPTPASGSPMREASFALPLNEPRTEYSILNQNADPQRSAMREYPSTEEFRFPESRPAASEPAPPGITPRQEPPMSTSVPAVHQQSPWNAYPQTSDPESALERSSRRQYQPLPPLPAMQTSAQEYLPPSEQSSRRIHRLPE